MDDQKVDKYLVFDDPEWIDLAINVIRKRRRQHKSLEMSSLEKSKITRFMESRGFSLSQIHQAIDSL